MICSRAQAGRTKEIAELSSEPGSENRAHTLSHSALPLYSRKKTATLGKKRLIPSLVYPIS